MRLFFVFLLLSTFVGGSSFLLGHNTLLPTRIWTARRSRFNTDCVNFSLGAKKKKKSSSAASSSSSGSGSGGGFGAVKEKGPPTKKQILKRVEQTYGGTTPQQIARATQERIQTRIRQLPAPIQMALQLYQQIQQWDAHLSKLSLLQQAQLDPSELEGAKRARNELNRMYQENKDIIASDQDLHNLLQKFTWDASADAKTARSMTGDMNAETTQRIERACQAVAEAVVEQEGLCLDVGCGFGVLVPFLIKAGVPAVNIHGVDLSEEMIKNAKEQHGVSKGKSPTFTSCDFLNEYNGPSSINGDNESSRQLFRAAIFCSCLHDLPDPMAALTKATSLLEVGGKIVIVHAQGASHVLKQVHSNPVLVQRGLPTTEELANLPNLRLLEEPAV
eukprot:CAMPEP_0198141880 /NCGR_PEP_ID=MMETSP1443-20131203/4813_1 /TAXON_ID=186043 /ORGANISM="Entomoneis sp., Strain CCMP2396" /LENGTH=388 /DNA_ID=CAMNT_0043804763 /DNA_START=166 /DNA_END=1328 /DNA_ORIENTATION=+